MKYRLYKLSILDDGVYELLVHGDEDTPLHIRCSVSGSGSEQKVKFVNSGPYAGQCDTPELRNAILSFHHARTVHYDPPAQSVRNAPPWFDPRPLLLSEIEAIGGSDYELRFTEQDGEFKTIRLRVVTLNRGDAGFSGVDVIEGQRINERIYPKDINALTVAFYEAVHSGEDK